MVLRLMGKNKKIEKTKAKNSPKVTEEKKLEKSNILISAGLILAMSSIGLLIFVLSEKVFHLS